MFLPGNQFLDLRSTISCTRPVLETRTGQLGQQTAMYRGPPAARLEGENGGSTEASPLASCAHGPITPGRSESLRNQPGAFSTAIARGPLQEELPPGARTRQLRHDRLQAEKPWRCRERRSGRTDVNYIKASSSSSSRTRQGPC